MRGTVLIVEDNSELLQLLGSSLRDAGYETVPASNGVEALHKVQQQPPDLILLDLLLPELDGMAVCQALRQDASTAEIPIVVVTGLNSEAHRQVALQAGANDYVTKPINPSALVSKVEQWT
jgi:CheY-like chemotaxis protein